MHADADVLDPLSTAVHLALLCYMPVGTKIGARQQRLEFYGPTGRDWVLRNFYHYVAREPGFSRNWLHNLRAPVRQAVAWYRDEAPTLIEYVGRGLERLKASYKEDDAGNVRATIDLVIGELPQRDAPAAAPAQCEDTATGPALAPAPATCLPAVTAVAPSPAPNVISSAPAMDATDATPPASPDVPPPTNAPPTGDYIVHPVLRALRKAWTAREVELLETIFAQLKAHPVQSVYLVACATDMVKGKDAQLRPLMTHT